MLRLPSQVALAGLALAALLVTPLFAAVQGGTLQSVDPETGRLVLESSSGKTTTFQIPASADIRVDGKKSRLGQLVPGQAVSVTTSRTGTVTRVSAREGNSKAAGSRAKSSSTDEASDEPAAPASRARSPRTTSRSGKEESTGWTQYRGPNRANRSAETGLLTEWDAGGPPRAWTAEGLGEGYATVALADGVLYTMGTEEGAEVVIALSLEDGKKLWTAKTGGGVYQDGNGNGPRGTPTVDGDNVYALGAEGHLVCLTREGKQKWAKNILQEFQASNIGWGICESVLIDGNQLVVTPGGKRATMAALNKANGSTLWTCVVPGTPSAAYASAIVVETAGVRQYVNFTHNSIIGVNAANGLLLWGDDHSANGTANCSAPVAHENLVFAASGYGKGGACVRLSKAGRGVNAAFLYHTDEMKNHHGGMVALDGYVYGSNDPGILTCLDMETGKVAWKDRSVGKGAVTFADGHLYLRSEGGKVALIEATPKEYREKGRFDEPQRSGRPAWSHPVVAAGKLFLRDQDKLHAFDVKR